METSTYLIVQIGFVVTTMVFYGLALVELKKGLSATPFSADRQRKILVRTIIALLLWMAFITILSLQGFFSDFSGFPPKFGIILVVPLISILIVTFSKTTKEILHHIPAQNILRLQVFRVVVEILLWLLLIQNLLPVQMTFEGRNFDILAGLTGPLIAYLYVKKKSGKTATIVWNVLGLGLLFNIVGIAIVSLPTPFRVFMNEPANTIVAYFPIIWLPGFLVPLAYTLHFLSIRQLTSELRTKN